MSNDEAIPIVKQWLVQCNELSPLRGTYSLDYNLNNTRKGGFYLISFDNLKKDNPDLYNEIKGRMECCSVVCANGMVNR
jgi:hypothetical protein